MTRSWNELIGALASGLTGGVPMLAFLSLLATVALALAAYYWPNWLPWNWRLRWRRGASSEHRTKAPRRPFRLGTLRWRWRWRRRKRGRPSDQDPAEPLELPDDELPDLPAEVLLLTADELSAAGRYRESVRERLRAILRDLTDRGILPISPGWTLTELAHVAAQARPPLAPPLRVAIDVFSEIWYGLRPANAEDDARLRAAANEVTQLLGQPLTSNRSGGTR